MGLNLLVIDTYALYEWLVYNNQKYKKYFEEIDAGGGFITELVLLEFYHHVFHERGKMAADSLFDAVTARMETVKLNGERIKKTGQKRSEMLREKKKLSYADCLNIVIAEEKNTKVLTGDKEFKDMKYAEFVK